MGEGFAVPHPVPFVIGWKSPLAIGSVGPFFCLLPEHKQYDLGSANGMSQLETLNSVWNMRMVTRWLFHYTWSIVVMVKVKAAVSVAMSIQVACQQSQTFLLVGLVSNSSYVNSWRCPVLALKSVSPALLAILKFTDSLK